MSDKRKFIGLCGGLSLEGTQNNAVLVSILENEFGFYRTSPIDAIYRFAKAIGVLKEELSEREERILINKVCISGKTADGNIWINMALKHVPPEKKFVLIDDVHFSEEYDTIKRLGGTVLRVNMPGVIVNPEFEPDMIVMGNTSEEIVKAFRHAVKITLQSEPVV